jgi:uncharacterized protein YecE (DUF72 family)
VTGGRVRGTSGKLALVEAQALGEVLRRGEHTLLVGTCSWTDRTLLAESDFYPRRSMSSEERLRFYAERFPIAEIDSTYYAPPSARQARLWAQRVPEGFRFDVKAYSLLTGHPTRRRSLWPDMRSLLKEGDENANVYARHLPPDAVEEAFGRFAEALAPLREAGRLGAVLFQYPPWFGPRRESRAELERLPERLPDLRVCVELRSPAWLAEERDRRRTLDTVRSLGLVLVCVDAPEASGLPRFFEATSEELFVARFHGRNEESWHGQARSAAERFRYLYSGEELEELVGSLSAATLAARESHLLLNNCYRDYGVRNAFELRRLLAGGSGG